MPTIPELLRDHVSLDVECVDRVYLNGYVPTWQTSGALVYFLEQQRGALIASPALLGEISHEFVAEVEAFAQGHQIPLVRFQKGQRKDDVAAGYRRHFGATEGVVFIGVAQEQQAAFKAHKELKGKRVRVQFSRQAVFVKTYYFYLQDSEFGPGFIKVGTYAPYPVKVCLNGHEGVKPHLCRAGVAFEALDHGFLSCADPDRLQALCQQLGPDQVQAFFDKWVARLPWPLTADDRAAGYQHRLSIWQMEVSRPQVFTRPLRGREFFEQIIRENLDWGRPDRVQLIFGRRVYRNTPSRFATRIIQTGVQPNLHLTYKHSGVKQYFKENRALRTETTINNPRDFKVGKDLANWPYLHKLGALINTRLPPLSLLTMLSERYVIAHEYGHALFHHGLVKDIESSFPTIAAWDKEFQADVFALLAVLESAWQLDLLPANIALQGPLFALQALEVLGEASDVMRKGKVMEDQGFDSHPPIQSRIELLKSIYRSTYCPSDNDFLTIKGALLPSETLLLLWKSALPRLMARRVNRKLHPMWGDVLA